jgi:hypothetical protein
MPRKRKPDGVEIPEVDFWEPPPVGTVRRRLVERYRPPHYVRWEIMTRPCSIPDDFSGVPRKERALPAGGTSTLSR